MAKKDLSENNIVGWPEAYRILSEALYSFKSKNPNRTGSRLFEKCFMDGEFKDNNLWIRNLAAYKTRYLDPIHVFASFNNNKLKNDKRIRLINSYLKLLNSKYEFENIDFTGCPAPIIISIIGPRKEDQVKQIWTFFENVRRLHKEALSEEIFIKVKSWYGVDITSLTIFLFWIDSSNFLPLDKNTVSLLKYYDKTTESIKRFQQYYDLLEDDNTSLYKNIAKVAVDSNAINKLPINEKRQFEQYFQTQVTKSTEKLTEARSDFKIIAIRPLKKCGIKYRKILQPNKTYYFYNNYNIKNSKEIIYQPNNSTGIYNLENTKINISAVVGKNGSGKSTIVDLLIVALNNISIKYLEKKYTQEFIYEPNLFVELYFKTSFFYRVLITGSTINLYRYENATETLFSNPKKLTDFDLEDLFYTICVNYSQYAFNENHLGQWINSLFHKNDAYQTPIVLDPFREFGNIDINVQEELLASRLLANLLEPQQEGDENSFRKLTPILRANKLSFSINNEKTSYLFMKADKEKVGFEELKDKEKCLSIIFKKFKVLNISNFVNDSNVLLSHAKKYILKKMVSISQNYAHYNRHFDERKVSYKDFGVYVDKLYRNTSHITFKLRQAINFLKFRLINTNKKYLVEKLSFDIQKVRSNNIKENFSTVELIPPSFFAYELELSNRVKFNSLSSGEKQKIYSIHSILYHIKNIDSVSSNDNLIKYPYVNILLDEIELYFHPELQRTYISYLLDSIKKAYLTNVSGINICFVTHSPFILSDIPAVNILFLKEKKEKHIEIDLRTFGANIHELLMNGFFMDNTLGEYAVNKINEIINFHERVENSTIEGLTELKTEYNRKKIELRFVVENLGEEYLKKILENHVQKIEEALDDTEFLSKKIKSLQGEIRSLKSKINAEN